MKILYINTYFNGGGAEKVMRQLYYGIKGEEAETYCMVGRLQKNVPDDVEIIYKDFTGRCVTTLMGGHLNNTLLKTRRAKNAIIECIRREKIDIVHFHNIHSNYIGLSDMEEIRKYCSNIVITLHDMWMLTGGCAHAFECKNWEIDRYCHTCKGNESMRRGMRYAPSLLKRKIRSFKKKGIYFVTPSEWLYELCRESYLKEENIRVISHGIALENFKCHKKSGVRKKYHLPENKHILLFAANGIHNVYKGFPYLQDALLKIADKEKYALLIVGNGKQEKIDLPFDIYDMGYIQNEVVLSEMYAAADLFILPSVADTSSFTAIEAMASGTPVLAFHTGGIPEIVTEESGWLVPSRDSEALADKINDIFLNRKELERKTALCRKYIEDNYSEVRMLNNYMKLYREIMDEIVSKERKSNEKN
ncbi:MAG: glycosyltransferase [Lachnospiraceae bacterium]|nr:glycosyltransferase [Lachnospiraceae bacterium]